MKNLKLEKAIESAYALIIEKKGEYVDYSELVKITGYNDHAVRCTIMPFIEMQHCEIHKNRYGYYDSTGERSELRSTLRDIYELVKTRSYDFKATSREDIENELGINVHTSRDIIPMLPMLYSDVDISPGVGIRLRRLY